MQIETARAAGARVKVEHAPALLNGRAMRVTVKHRREFCRRGVQRKHIEIVQQIEIVALEEQNVGGRQFARRAGAVDIAAHGMHGRDAHKFLEDSAIAYVAEVQNVVDTGESRRNFGPQQAVCIADDADLHLPKPKRDFQPFFSFGCSLVRKGSVIRRSSPPLFISSIAMQ